MVNAKKFNIRIFLFSCKKLGFRKSKLIACQLILVALYKSIEYNLDKNELIDIFKQLNEKYIKEEDRFEWIDDISE